MIRTLTNGIAAILLVLAGIAVANAQTGPSNPPVNPPTNPTPAVVNGFSEADLLNALKQVDPNVTTGKLENGTEYRFNIKVDGWNYVIRIESYANQIWLNAELGSPMTDMTKIPANYLVDLLNSQLKVGPTHFTFMKKGNGQQLTACRLFLRNGSLESLGKELGQLCKDVRDTYAQWNAIVSVK